MSRFARKPSTATTFLLVLLSILASAIASPLFAQVSPGSSPLSVAKGGTGAETAAGARSNLQVDKFTGHGDSAYAIVTSDRVVGTNASFTASRTWTLPAANAVNAGHALIVADFAGTVTGSNTLVIARAGGDTINGGASVTISTANGAVMLVSDGSSKWTAQAIGASSVSGISSLDGATGAISTQIGSLDVTGSTLSSNVLSSRAFAATQDLSAFSVIRVLGYTSAGDGGEATLAKVGSQPFCANFTNTAAFQDAGSNWWDIAEPADWNIKQFGAKVDASTDDTTAVQSALYCAGLSPPAGAVTVTGAFGRIVRVPPGISMISTTVIVPEGVTVRGGGALASTFQMTTGFPAAQHMFILGEQFQQNDIALVQSGGGAGNLTLNGSRVRSGVAYTLGSRGPQICSGDNNNTTTFTLTGINAATGLSDTEALLGPAGGNCVTSTKGWLSISQVATSASYNNVTVGYGQVATFAARLEELQLFSSNTNATKFSTFINSSYAGTSGVTGNAMVYTNSVQHTGGVRGLKIVAGNRSGTIFEVGMGGASLFVYEDMEIVFSGNCGGCASNSPGAYFNYGALLSPVRRLVMQGASSAGSVAMRIDGGLMHITDFHVEGVPTGIDIFTPSINAGIITVSNSFGGTGVTDLIKIEAGAASNLTHVSTLMSNGSTNTINNKGALSGSINVVTWTLY
ncbi:hypothetical protein WI560_13525 [Bradyrhizobium sp. A11]|uniref:glycosyl hydrolase family 28-related protein n=1 Tax=Bradyrhizobium sp. A11 TaxID=3133974 RepID=UPI0032431C99